MTFLTTIIKQSLTDKFEFPSRNLRYSGRCKQFIKRQLTEMKITAGMLGVFILLTFFNYSCKSQVAYYEGEKIIKKPCELNSRINDTIIVSGIYSGCMEYTSFNLLQNDDCYNDFEIDLNFDTVEISKNLETKLYKIQDCATSMKMTLKGVLEKNKSKKYGHLGTNNAELKVVEFINVGKVKYD